MDSFLVATIHPLSSSKVSRPDDIFQEIEIFIERVEREDQTSAKKSTRFRGFDQQFARIPSRFSFLSRSRRLPSTPYEHRSSKNLFSPFRSIPVPILQSSSLQLHSVVTPPESPPSSQRSRDGSTRPFAVPALLPADSWSSCFIVYSP